MSDGVDRLEERICRVLELVLRRSLSGCSPTDSLADIPDMLYDSLVQLEAATRIELEFGLPAGAVAPGDLVTIRAAAVAVRSLGASAGAT